KVNVVASSALFIDAKLMNASYTANRFTSLAKVIHDNFGISEGLMILMHAITTTQNTVDSLSSNSLRDGRSASQNIIPASTGATKTVGKLIPNLNRYITKDEGNCKQIADSLLSRILGYTEKQVSTDLCIDSDSHSSYFSASAGIAHSNHFVKLVSWYHSWILRSNMLLENCFSLPCHIQVLYDNKSFK
uniref:glyceraldehyde-3-phosphate dehydrogenase (phosphorylating) n=1 Tax=Electrophorus electricus TaxID=8005 RepID=A0A4W4EUM9_ELEEL